MQVCQVTDEDVRWGAKSDRKTWPGYKLHNTMTENKFITGVMVTPANVTDDKKATPLYEQKEKKPETVTGGCVPISLFMLQIYKKKSLKKSGMKMNC